MDGDAGGNKLHEIYHTGLRNLAALEQTAIELTERQIERIENYPEMKAQLQKHHAESRQQAQRLESILERHGTSSSSAKNTVLAAVGNMAAALHAPAPDEILKNTFANYAFEHQEIASYMSIITMAERVGDTAAIPLLQQSLAEEQAMAKFIEDAIAPTTEKYLHLSATGQTAGI